MESGMQQAFSAIVDRRFDETIWHAIRFPSGTSAWLAPAADSPKGIVLPARTEIEREPTGKAGQISYCNSLQK